MRISVRANRLDIITMLLRSVPYRVWRYRCTLTVAKAKGDNQKPPGVCVAPAESTRFRLRNLVLSFLSSDSFTEPTPMVFVAYILNNLIL